MTKQKSVPLHSKGAPGKGNAKLDRAAADLRRIRDLQVEQAKRDLENATAR